MKKALKRTQLMVLMSVVLSCLSFWTTQKGWSEIYPFYFWKLYSQPAGWAKSYTGYRVYAKNPSDTTWTRLQNQQRATFNKDETLYFLNPITQRLSAPQQPADQREKDLKKLKIFCQYIAPQYQSYKVVAEVFNPLDLLEDNTRYDTVTLVQIP